LCRKYGSSRFDELLDPAAGIINLKRFGNPPVERPRDFAQGHGRVSLADRTFARFQRRRKLLNEKKRRATMRENVRFLTAREGQAS
jgi:hypothetical protein